MPAARPFPVRPSRPLTVAGRAVVLVLALVAALAAPGAAPAWAAPTPCTAREVTVVVEGIGIGCSPAGFDGARTLQAAGFSIEFVQTQPGFICRINGQPADDPCMRTPPASAYWAYYHARLGGTWEYSDKGAGNYYPRAGTVEGWAFGNGAEPGPVPDPVDDFTYTPWPDEPTTKPAPDPGRGGDHGGGNRGGGDGRGDGGGAGGGAPAPAAPGANPPAPQDRHDNPAPENPAPPGNPGAAPAPDAQDADRPDDQGEDPTPTTGPTSPGATTATTQTPHRRDLGITPRGPDEGNDVNGDPDTVLAEPTGEDSGGPGVWPVVGILAVAVAVGCGAWLVSRRRAQQPH